MGSLDDHRKGRRGGLIPTKTCSVGATERVPRLLGPAELHPPTEY